ncbi:protein modifying enzyme [Lithospermum erythrorhizon]|uniref:Protein modifying enzyme n=1 Tax=Lithospermum erythrorhizon TaxID=34254 RepID=A0AAV3QX70_LITER
MVSLFLKPLNLNFQIAHFTHNLKHHILTRAMSSSSPPSQQCIFQLRLNPLSGDSEWVVIQENDEQQPPKQPLLAATSYLDMLNDSSRNKAFRDAIDKTITKPCHVLDIGAGTGLLSMMAARAMRLGDMTVGSGSKGMVTACESYLPMVKLMRKVLCTNNMERHIRIFNKRSDEVEVGVDVPSLADVLVSEILDSELLGEGLIPTLQHAHEKLLVENPLTVPYRATVFGQLVENTYLRRLHDLYNNESEVLDEIKLVPKGMGNILSVKRRQYAMHCDAITKEVKLLSEPFKIFDFEFWKRPESCRETELCIKAVSDGNVHAVISWWILQLDSEATIFYSTAPNWINIPTIENELVASLPGAQYWCDHWKQCVWFIPKDGLPVHKNHDVYLQATHTATSISYEVKTSPQKMDFEQYGLCTEDCQVFLSPERIAIYGDSSWRCLMLKSIKNAVQHMDDPLCVVADDSIFLAVAVASLSKTSKLITLFPDLRWKGIEYLRSVSDANGFSIDRVEIATIKNLLLTMSNSNQRKIDLLIGEPFYSGIENMLPWQSLRFW